MAFCKNCGAELDEGAKFCASCGSPVEAPEVKAAPEEEKASEAPKGEESTADKVKAALESGADHSAEFDEKDKTDNKVMAILAYIGFLFLVPIFAAPQSKFARFHANQGLLLFIAEILIGILGRIPLIGWIIDIVGYILVVIFVLKGIVGASSGEAKEIPYIGKFRIIK